VYQIEALQKPSPEKEIIGKQLKIMAKRLWYIITWPSMILAIFFAIILLFLQPAYLQAPWMQVKLIFVALLLVYHFKCHRIFLNLQKDVCPYTSSYMRIFNEGATVLLFAIVFLVILKNAINWVYGVLGIVLLATLLMLAIKWYKNKREKK
jgi:putative membrane protein